MRLSDVIGHSGLSGYAEVALILFLIAFVSIAVRLFLRSRSELDRDARLPFDEGDPAPARKGERP